jgi:hypothetical protein
MPDWWIPGDFDVALCHAAYRVGLLGLPHKISSDKSLGWVFELFKNYFNVFPSSDVLIDRIRCVVDSCRQVYDSVNKWPCALKNNQRSDLVNLSSHNPNRYVIYRTKGQLVLPVSFIYLHFF